MVRTAEETDLPWIRGVLTASYGAPEVVTGDRIRNAAELPALIAEIDGEPAGLLTYEIGAPGLEIVTVDAPVRRRGAGTALLEAAREVAVRAGVRRVWLITTNDNLDALRFYQRRGMRIVRVHPGAVQRARLRKPAIPVVGDYGITLHDELELDLLVTPGAPPVHVRPGTLADVTAVLALLDNATEWLVGLGRTGQWGTEPHSTNPRRVASMMRWVPQGQLHVAESGGAVTGALAVGAAPEWVPAVEEPELYVNLLVTDRARKGEGLGGVLLDHARALAVQRGLELLRVDCYGGGDRALVGWYERQGFTPSAPFAVPLPDGTEWPGQVLEQRLR